MARTREPGPSATSACGRLPQTAAEDFLKVILRGYERAFTFLTSNRPDCGLGDTAAVTAFLDRLLHHVHVLKCGPRSWRTKLQTDLRAHEVDSPLLGQPADISSLPCR